MVKELKVKKVSKLNMFVKRMISKMWMILFLVVSFLFYDYASRVSRVENASREIESSLVYKLGGSANSGLKLAVNGSYWVKSQALDFWTQKETINETGEKIEKSKTCRDGECSTKISPPLNKNDNPANINY